MEELEKVAEHLELSMIKNAYRGRFSRRKYYVSGEGRIVVQADNYYNNEISLETVTAWTRLALRQAAHVVREWSPMNVLNIRIELTIEGDNNLSDMSVDLIAYDEHALYKVTFELPSCQREDDCEPQLVRVDDSFYIFMRRPEAPAGMLTLLHRLNTNTHIKFYIKDGLVPRPLVAVLTNNLQISYRKRSLLNEHLAKIHNIANKYIVPPRLALMLGVSPSLVIQEGLDEQYVRFMLYTFFYLLGGSQPEPIHLREPCLVFGLTPAKVLNVVLKLVETDEAFSLDIGERRYVKHLLSILLRAAERGEIGEAGLPYLARVLNVILLRELEQYDNKRDKLRRLLASYLPYIERDVDTELFWRTVEKASEAILDLARLDRGVLVLDRAFEASVTLYYERYWIPNVLRLADPRLASYVAASINRILRKHGLPYLAVVAWGTKCTEPAACPLHPVLAVNQQTGEYAKVFISHRPIIGKGPTLKGNLIVADTERMVRIPISFTFSKGSGGGIFLIIEDVGEPQWSIVEEHSSQYYIDREALFVKTVRLEVVPPPMWRGQYASSFASKLTNLFEKFSLPYLAIAEGDEECQSAGFAFEECERMVRPVYVVKTPRWVRLHAELLGGPRRLVVRVRDEGKLVEIPIRVVGEPREGRGEWRLYPAGAPRLLRVEIED